MPSSFAAKIASTPPVSSEGEPALETAGARRIDRAIARLALTTLAVTVTFGVILRFWLAGAPAFQGASYESFSHLRHAHSHLGYYGLLFPLSWAALRRSHGTGPSANVLRFYAAAVALAIGGFLAGGYTFYSIAGSTLVGGVWLHVAWRNRKAVSQWTGWRASTALGVVLAACFIPPIGILTPRDPALAAQFVRTFLTLLLLNVFVPAALLRARPPVAPIWFGASLAAALGTAFVDLRFWSVGWGVLAVFIWRASCALPLLLRALWNALALSFVVMATTFFNQELQVGIAGLHFIVLGPLLLTFGWPWISRLPNWLLALYLSAVGTMCTTILTQTSWGMRHFNLAMSTKVAAWSGATIALSLCLAALLVVFGGRNQIGTSSLR